MHYQILTMENTYRSPFNLCIVNCTVHLWYVLSSFSTLSTPSTQIISLLLPPPLHSLLSTLRIGYTTLSWSGDSLLLSPIPFRSHLPPWWRQGHIGYRKYLTFVIKAQGSLLAVYLLPVCTCYVSEWKFSELTSRVLCDRNLPFMFWCLSVLSRECTVSL